MRALPLKEFAKLAKLTKLLDARDESQANLQSRDGVSIKQVIDHRLHWLDLFFGW